MSVTFSVLKLGENVTDSRVQQSVNIMLMSSTFAVLKPDRSSDFSA